MTTFIQLHLLTSYPPSNLNRDDLGQPKTALVGGTQRLRVSSQCRKRAWRTSDVFSDRCFENLEEERIGIRSKRFAKTLFSILTQGELSETDADVWTKDILRTLGKLDTKKDGRKTVETRELSQLVHLSIHEQNACEDYCNQILAVIRDGHTIDNIEEIIELQKKRDSKKKPEDKKKISDQIANKIRPFVLGQGKTAVDIALFGRMLASSPAFNVEAAAQVAHAITVNAVKIEDDFFTAVDDLNRHEEDAGAGHMGDTGFGSGIFYQYICINRDLLVENLQGDETLANQAIAALTEAAAKVAPTGKQNSFASRAYTSYLLAEKGGQQPRSLSVAFLKAIRSDDLMKAAIAALEDQRIKFDKVYGPCADAHKAFNVEKGEGSLDDILDFVQS